MDRRRNLDNIQDIIIKKLMKHFIFTVIVCHIVFVKHF